MTRRMRVAQKVRRRTWLLRLLPPVQGWLREKCADELFLEAAGEGRLIVGDVETVSYWDGMTFRMWASADTEPV